LEQAIAYEITTGQLDLDARVDLQDEQLDAELDAMLRRLKVKKATGTDIENELGMPLTSALNLVRDSDDNIRLENIAIKGNLGDPEVSARQLITKAVSKALLSGSMTFFKFALQPYGAALMAAEMIGKQAGKIRLEPLRMTPGLAEVAADHVDYIDRIADVMTQRPQVHIMLCGEASSRADVPEQETTTEAPAEPVDHTPMLTALADDRASAVKRILFDRGLSSERLLICKSTINDDPAGARVVLRID
jgi:hypothetical protein